MAQTAGAGEEAESLPPLPVVHLAPERLARITEDVLAEQSDECFDWCMDSMNSVRFLLGPPALLDLRSRLQMTSCAQLANSEHSAFPELCVRYALETLRIRTDSFSSWSPTVPHALRTLDLYANELSPSPKSHSFSPVSDCVPDSQLLADSCARAVVSAWAKSPESTAPDTTKEALWENFPDNEKEQSFEERNRKRQLQNWLRNSTASFKPPFSLPSEEELLKRAHEYHDAAVAALGDSLIGRALNALEDKGAICVHRLSKIPVDNKGQQQCRARKGTSSKRRESSNAAEVSGRLREGTERLRDVQGGADVMDWARMTSAKAKRSQQAGAAAAAAAAPGNDEDSEDRAEDNSDDEEEEEDDCDQEHQEKLRVAKQKARVGKRKGADHDENENGRTEKGKRKARAGVSVATPTGAGRKVAWDESNFDTDDGVEATPDSHQRPQKVIKVRQSFCHKQRVGSFLQCCKVSIVCLCLPIICGSRERNAVAGRQTTRRRSKATEGKGTGGRKRNQTSLWSWCGNMERLIGSS